MGDSLQERAVKAGSILIWQPMSCHKHLLKQELDAAGIKQKIPERDDSTILAAALVAGAETVAPLGGTNCAYYTKPRKRNVATELYKLCKGDKDRPNQIAHVATGRIEKNILETAIEDQAWAQDVLADFKAAVQHELNVERNTVNVASVTEMVMQQIHGLHGNPFRGGVYYLPEQSRPKFEQFLGCLLRSRKAGDGKPYLLTQYGDADTVKAICEQTLEAIVSEAQAMETEIAGCVGKMRSDGIRTRQAKVEHLRASLEVYRDILGANADRAKAGIDAADAALTYALVGQLAEVPV